MPMCRDWAPRRRQLQWLATRRIRSPRKSRDAMRKLPCRLHELYSVSEGIVDVHADVPLHGFVVIDRVSVSAERLHEALEVFYEESWGGLARRTKGILD